MAKIYGERWKTVQQLGEGGQAHTYIVEDLKANSGIHYALKRLKNVKRLGRFKTEIDILRRLSHPNVIKLVDFDFDNNPPYFVSELCEGGDLGKHKGLYINDPVRALDLFIEVCQGVAAAHDVGVIHRDIKPENVLFRKESEVVVADFGIAYVAEGERQTLTDEAVGPRNFIAPEFEDGLADKVSQSSDIYSLGKLLYWLMSGRIFSREKHRAETFNLIKLSALSVPRKFLLEHVNLLLDKMILAEPQKRISSVNQVIEEAKQAQSLIEFNYNPLSKEVPQLCRYCGQAGYKLLVNQQGVNGSIDVNNFGLQAIQGGERWRILKCPNCGHIEFFRKDDWWGSERMGAFYQ